MSNLSERIQEALVYLSFIIGVVSIASLGHGLSELSAKEQCTVTQEQLDSMLGDGYEITVEEFCNL